MKLERRIGQQADETHRAWCPCVPGRVAYGQTREEARSRVDWAVQGCPESFSVTLPSGRSSEISPTDVSAWIKKARELPEVREELVARIKAEIDAGDYETPEKLTIAASRLLADLLGRIGLAG
jgi:anti-sigma28 factor (negative regulator of flagellin synthesis)